MDRLLAWYRLGSSIGAVVALLLANAIPLVGVLFLGWSVWTILIVYWLENGIVGVFNILKMLKAQGQPDEAAATMTMNGRPLTANTAATKAALVPFFVIHYGLFWLVHGIFVLTLPLFAGMGSDDPSSMTEGVSVPSIALALVALVLSHGASFYLNFLRGGEYRRVSPQGQMFAPYGRLVVLHLTIIFGAIAISIVGAPQVAVVILVVLKTMLDLGLHMAEHRGTADRPVSAAA